MYGMKNRREKSPRKPSAETNKRMIHCRKNRDVWHKGRSRCLIRRRSHFRLHHFFQVACFENLFSIVTNHLGWTWKRITLHRAILLYSFCSVSCKAYREGPSRPVRSCRAPNTYKWLLWGAWTIAPCLTKMKRHFDSSLQGAELPFRWVSPGPLPSQANVNCQTKSNLRWNNAVLLLQLRGAVAECFRGIVDHLHIIRHLLL